MPDSLSRDIFDRNRRRQVRLRAARRPVAGADFLYRHMAEELVERLHWVSRDFSKALIIGEFPLVLAAALAARGIAVVHAHPTLGGVLCDEDRLPFADASFDLILSIGVLDSVNDVPGALLLMRRVLRPDGLLLGGFTGAGSLSVLRRILLESEGDSAAPHVHPQIDVRAAGDLLARAGFAMPVADGENLTVRYAALTDLVRDLRAMGAGNVLASARRPLTRASFARAAAQFSAISDPDGKTGETFALVYLSGWAPSPDQPKPARRGSGTVSLAAALKPKI